MARRTRNDETSFGDLPGPVQLIIVVLFLALIIWGLKDIEPFKSTIQSAIDTAIFIGKIVLVIVLIGVVGYTVYKIYNWRENIKVVEEQKAEKERKEREKREHEEEQMAKGLVKFTDRFGKEKWGTPEEVEDWKRRDEEEKIMASLLYNVVESIKKFKPSRKYRNEFGYHTELQGWLKANFPSTKVEIQTGASRPDIVIDDIAIEVKGPTDNQALNSLTTKCLKYSKYYKNIICVLFEPSFSNRNFQEIQEGLKRSFPNVKIIIKE